MYYTFRFSTLVYVLKTEMALFTWILFYRTTFSFYRELMLCLWIINCCWKSTAALNYLCWREPVSDKKGTEHIAAAWEEKRLGGKSRLVGRDIDSIQGRFGREDMDPLILDRATVWARFHLYFFCGSSNSMFVIFQMLKKYSTKIKTNDV